MPTINISNLFEYQSFQGKLYQATRDAAGLPQGFKYVGNVPDLKVALSVDELDHQESTSGNRLQDLLLIKAKKALLSFDLETMSKENMEMGLYSAQVNNAGTAVTNEIQASPLAVGDYMFTKHGNITAISVKDSLAATLALTTNYLVVDAVSGLIQIVNLGGFTQPFNLNYTYAQEIIIPFFANIGLERYYKFVGMNAGVNPTKPVAMDFYRCYPKPVKEFAMINPDLNKFSIEANVLADTTRAADPNFLQFGRYIPLS